MDEQKAFKNILQEIAVIHKRLWFVLFIVLFAFSILLWRFYQLQVVNFEKYQTQSRENRVHMQRLSPQRGLIYDRNQILLADNQPSHMLVVYRDQVKDLQGIIEGLLELSIIDEQEEETFYQRAKNYRAFEAVPIRLNIGEAAMARFAAQKHRFQGVEIQASLMRHYPQGELLAHMLGYISRINERERQMVDAENYAATEYIGKIGVERSYEQLLHGEVGYEYVETNARGKVLRTLETTLPAPGKNLRLHLDLDMQGLGFELLGEHRGAIVALDAKTAGVIAAVSTPSYDPNLFARRITFKQYQSLQDDIDLPLFNRVLQAQYPPASTLKPFVGLAGLEEKTVNMSTKVYDPGWYQLPNDSRYYRDWKRTGHGFIDLKHAMEQSCDVYFYDLAYKLGIQKIHSYLALFGFGQATGIDVLNERRGVNPSPEWKRSQGRGGWFPGDSLNVGIGQGYMLATPMQLAHATNIIANRGKVMIPQMVAEIDGQATAKQSMPAIKLKNERHWDDIIGSMEGVLHNWRGTAYRHGRDLSYKMAGKSGTAQVIGIAQGEKYDASQVALRKRDHALFIAFAPVEDPVISVAVIVENGESGSAVAGAMAKAMVEAWMKKQGEEQHD